MKHLVFATCLVFGLWALNAPLATAAIMLSMSSSETLTNLKPGDSINIDVVLSDLPIQIYQNSGIKC